VGNFLYYNNFIIFPLLSSLEGGAYLPNGEKPPPRKRGGAAAKEGGSVPQSLGGGGLMGLREGKGMYAPLPRMPHV
jgi:hypothetical protein